jgi:hypothetical protein
MKAPHTLLAAGLVLGLSGCAEQLPTVSTGGGTYIDCSTYVEAGGDDNAIASNNCPTTTTTTTTTELVETTE